MKGFEFCFVLIGLQISGYNACPLCGPALQGRHSKSLKKIVYEGHKKYLPDDHEMRQGFLGRGPKPLKSSDWLKIQEKYPDSLPLRMKHLSIFHTLPYWDDLLINHLLDPMHIFKNIGEMLWKTITGAKDNKGQRDDLQAMQRMPNLWAKIGHNGKVVLPKAPWVLTKEEYGRVKKAIQDFRTPTGYMHCLKGAFTANESLSGLKSHDWNTFIQFVLLVAIKDCFTNNIRETI